MNHESNEIELSVEETHQGRNRQAFLVAGLALIAAVLVGIALFKASALLTPKVWVGLFAMLFGMSWVFVSDETWGTAWEKLPEIVGRFKGQAN